jgi:hypothetical protein
LLGLPPQVFKQSPIDLVENQKGESMRRLGVVRALVIVALSLAAGARPASATPVTLNFSGTADLTFFGLGPSAFSGFFTWDSNAAPFEEGESPGEMVYDVIAYQMILNGVDYTLPIVGEGFGNGASVADNAEVLGDGVSWDGLAFFAALPIFPGLENNLIFAGLLLGPTTMFDSTALPANTDFLSQVTNPFSIWFVEDSDDLRPGTFVASAPAAIVPEPSTLALMMFGVVGAIARARRSEKIR